MQFQEFPKALYEGGDVEKAYAVVANDAEEATKREQGFRMAGEPEPKGAAKPAKKTT